MCGQFREIVLPKGQSRFGRTAEGGFEISSPAASKVHAVIECDEVSCTITDISKNGTVVNGQRLPLNQPKHLQNGDQICIADTLFVYCDDCGSGARPTSTVISSGTANDDDSVRRNLIAAKDSVTLISFTGNGEVSPEKIRGKIALGDQPLASLATTDSVKRLSHLLRFMESVRDFSESGNKAGITMAIAQLFPQTSQIAVAIDISQASRTYWLWLSHSNGDFSDVVCDEVIQRAARDREALLVRDQWRDQASHAPKLSTMDRISLLCAPLFGLNNKCCGVIQLISTAQGPEFELADLERLAILAQLLTIVLPRPASA